MALPQDPSTEPCFLAAAQVVVFVGMDEHTEKEGTDRQRLVLPGAQLGCLTQKEGGSRLSMIEKKRMIRVF